MTSPRPSPVDTDSATLRPRPWWQIGLFFVVLGLLCYFLHGTESIDEGITRHYIGRTALGFLLGATLLARCLGGRVAASAPEIPRTAPRRRAISFFAGLFVVAAALMFLEIRQPYYFTTDDTLSYSLPVELTQMHFLMHGEFPQWNPYSLLGEPTSGLGMVTYPPTFFSYLIARFALGNEFAMFEVFAFIHLLLAYVAAYFAARKIGITSALATTGSVCYTLCGYALLAGRSWNVVAFAPLLMAPLLALSLAQLQSGKIGWRWASWTGLMIGAFYHCGFPQVWGYGLLCFLPGVALILIAMPTTRRSALWLVPAMGIAAAVALPLFITQWNIAHGIERPATFTAGIEEGLANMLLPYPLATAQVAGFGGEFRQSIGQLYYSGTVFIAVTLFGIGSIVAFRISRRSVAANIWLWIALLALLVALGAPGGIWWAMFHLPVVGTMSNYPFRMLPFVNLFAILAGGLILQKFPRTNLPAGAMAILLTLFGVFWCRASFSILSFKPYPPLPAQLEHALRPPTGAASWRVMPLGPTYSARTDFSQSLPLAVSSAYQVYSPLGYDAAIGSSRLYRDVYTDFAKAALTSPLAFADALQRYGVRFIAVYNPRSPGDERFPDYFNNQWVPQFIRAAEGNNQFSPAGRNLGDIGNVSLFELPHPDPLAFPAGNPAQALPVQMHGYGMSVDTRSLTGDSGVVINVLAWPQWVVYCDGAEAVTQPDAYHRLLALIPAGTKQIQIRFEPGWSAGIRYGAILLLLSVAAMFALACRSITVP